MLFSSDVATLGQLRQCNDPLRPEWGIFSDLLERRIEPAPGMSSEAASRVLKQSLFDAFGKDRAGFLVKMLHRRGDERSRFVALQREAGTFPGGWAAMSEEIALRLVAPIDGSKNVVTDAERVSSYHALSWWEPAKGGLVPYMRQRIGWVLQDMSRERAERSHFVSFEALSAVGIDIDDGGRVVRHQADAVPDHDAEPDESPLSLIGETVAPRVVGVGRARAEYDLFERVLGHPIQRADSPAARVVQLRSLAVLAGDLVRGGQPDAVMEKRLRAWDPAAAELRHTFPELATALETAAEFAPAPSRVPSPEVELAAVERLSAREHGGVVLVKLAVAAEEFWNARALSEGELASTERPDYAYLALVTGREVEPDARPPSLFGQIRAMARDWAEAELGQETERFAGRVNIFRRLIENYDPATDGFLGEYLSDPEVWKESAAPCPLPEAGTMQMEFFGEALPGLAVEPAMG